ncbi:MAG: methyltransferase domain-containing protein [Phycisphaerales bacterium]|nr:methyltransferase domain-containing protein [Phycisphaerales bacterium]
MGIEASEDWWNSQNAHAFFPSVYYHGDDSFEGHVENTELNQSERTKREIRGILQMLRPLSGHRVVDCPCGIGRHSLTIAESSPRFRVTGIDLSKTAIHTARKKAREKSLENCRFIEGDMRKLPIEDATHDYVLNLFLSFGFFLAQEDNQQVLREAARVLKPGGKILIHTDVNPLRIQAGTYADRSIRTLRDGAELNIYESFNSANKRLEGKWTILGPHDEQRQAAYSIRIYDHEEMRQMLHACGFHDVKIRAFPPSAKDSDKAQEIAYLATK